MNVQVGSLVGKDFVWGAGGGIPEVGREVRAPPYYLSGLLQDVILFPEFILVLI